MDAGDLRIFEAVARLGGMNRAAGELNTVQSNVTTRVRQLEDELNVPLFDRHSRGVSLTAAGQRLLPYAIKVADLLNDARRAVADEGEPGGPLVIGALETSAALRLSPILTAYAAAFPAVDLTLHTGTTAELIEAVLAHRLEGAFVCGPVNHPALAGEDVFVEELVALTAPSVRSLEQLAARSDVRIVVLRAGCSYRQRLEAMLAERGIVGLRQLEFGTIDAIVGCVAAGLGVTLLPRGAAEPAIGAGRVRAHRLPPKDSRVATVFIRREGGYVSRALAAFLDHVRARERAAVA